MKHIETILPEHAADELTRLLLDNDTVSSALKELLHHTTGCDIPSLDNVPTSDIEEMIPLCLGILRRFLYTPLTSLGDGTEKQSIADLMRQLIGDRAQGNEAWGIHAVNGNIPATVSALHKRKISGVPNAADGISLVQLLCADNSNIISLTDDNSGWDCKQGIIAKVLDIFQNLESLVLGCGSMTDTVGIVNRPNLKSVSCPNMTYLKGKFMDNCDIDEIEFQSLKYWEPTEQQFRGQKRLLFPELNEVYQNGTFYTLAFNPTLEEFYAPKMRILSASSSNAFFQNSTKLWKVVFGQIHDPTYHAAFMDNCPNLIHLEFGADGKFVNTSLKTFVSWNPTNALDASLDTLVTDEDCHNNLEQFLKNFQTYIADRVADMTGKGVLTLTLSAAVYAALEAQEGRTILATLTNKNWTVEQA